MKLKAVFATCLIVFFCGVFAGRHSSKWNPGESELITRSTLKQDAEFYSSVGDMNQRMVDSEDSIYWRGVWGKGLARDKRTTALIKWVLSNDSFTSGGLLK